MADTSNDQERRSRSPHRPLLGSAAPSSPSTSSTLRSTNLTLSPAVSAFQFMNIAGSQKLGSLGAPLVRSSTAPISRSLSNEGHAAARIPSPLGVSSSSSEMQRSVSGADVMPTMSANDLHGYFAAKGKPQVDDRKKEELRKSAAVPLQNEWTFWLDKQRDSASLYVIGAKRSTPTRAGGDEKLKSDADGVQSIWRVSHTTLRNTMISSVDGIAISRVMRKFCKQNIGIILWLQPKPLF
ncbi:hypothetical protein BC937DRAFT_87525 [Endogone sp. FLAS-F59071]|nr:hypothetical protein BC937DRAFT_87525 [Endogone sp. FLAS-F59071]|eukprot:RUS19413.1 hypothetical protein BC937DRAFT_87525 [Endogone sp. FLAS-F59071]